MPARPARYLPKAAVACEGLEEYGCHLDRAAVRSGSGDGRDNSKTCVARTIENGIAELSISFS
ncbi:hypothetical protein [Micromonospora avicenniae]|uniref:hypothetical protein n=1 Tax=Micromonospora avicenniae TaxID=1198245 RepID=UPI0034232309